MADWKFGRRQGGCVICDREFLEKEPHVSLLQIEELELGRKDICRECFAKEDGEDESKEGQVWWRTRHTVAIKKGVQLDLESLHALFEALESKEDVGWQELRYLLCLILMRKRRIKVISVKRIEGLEVFVVRKPRFEKEQIVQIFDFTPERQDELRGTLTAIFEGADLSELDPNAPVPLPESEAEGEESDASEETESAGEETESASAEADSDPAHENGAADPDPVGA